MPLYQSLHYRLKNQHESLEQIIADTEPGRLTIQPAPAKWSVKDNLAHLASYQPVFLERIKKILEENEPYFERYVADIDPQFEAWRGFTLDELIQRLYSGRSDIFNFITSLNDESLQRAGYHPKFGRLSILQWTEFFLLHEAHHQFTIFRLVNDIDQVKQPGQ